MFQLKDKDQAAVKICVPDVVYEKSRIGDLEIDLIIGKGHSGALVTIVERKINFTVSTRVNDRIGETEE